MPIVIVLLLMIAFLMYKDLASHEVTSVVLHPDVAQTMNEKYDPELEIAGCLFGTKTDGVVFVDEVKYPADQDRQSHSVEYGRCTGLNVVGMYHTHPEGDCLMSDIDIYNFGRSDLPFAGVMCGLDQLVFFSDNGYVGDIS